MVMTIFAPRHRTGGHPYLRRVHRVRHVGHVGDGRNPAPSTVTPPPAVRTRRRRHSEGGGGDTVKKVKKTR